MPALSLLVPVYNAQTHLRACLDSLRAQTCADFEAVLVDDGSTDQSGAILDEYARLDNRFRVVHQKNGGQNAARLAALNASRGEYIGFVDSDDRCAPEMFDHLLKSARAEQADIVICAAAEELDGRLTPIPQGCAPGVYDRERLEKEVFPRLLYAGVYGRFGLTPTFWDKIYRREWIERYLPVVDTDIRMGEDGACVYPAILSAQKLVLLDGEPMYYYRYDPQSISRASDPRYFERMKKLTDYLKKVLLPEPVFREQLDYYITLLTLLGVGNEARCGVRKTASQKARITKNSIRAGGWNESLQRISLKNLPKREMCYALFLRLRLYTPLFLWLTRKK